MIVRILRLESQVNLERGIFKTWHADCDLTQGQACESVNEDDSPVFQCIVIWQKIICVSAMISHACAHQPCTMNDTTQFIANAVILCDVCIVCNMIWQKIIPLLSLSYNSKITRGCLASHVINCDKFILRLDREVKLKVCWNMVTFLYICIFISSCVCIARIMQIDLCRDYHGLPTCIRGPCGHPCKCDITILENVRVVMMIMENSK